MPVTVYLDAVVRTCDPRTPQAEAFVVDQGAFVFVGSGRDALAFAGADATVVLLGNRTVTPGFCDAHLHLYMYGAGLLRTADLLGCASIDELLARVADHAVRFDGPWVQGRGWDQDKLAERRLPTRAELDAVCPDRPVIVTRVCGHAAVVNSAALALVSTAERAAGDPESGLYTETRITPFYRAIPPLTEAEGEEAVRRACAVALRSGITSVGTLLDVPEQMGAYARLRQRGQLPLRVTGMPPYRAVEALHAHGVNTTFGDSWLQFGGAKFFSDGSFGARTALLAAPYSDEDRPENLGIRIYPPDELCAKAADAQAKGFQIVIHAIGDQAVRESIAAIEYALGNDGDNTFWRHRIEHVALLPPDLLARMAERKIVGVVQPQFITSDTWTGERVGPERAAHAYPFAAMLAAGIPLALSSDCPVEMLDSFACLHAAVNRHPWSPEGGLSVDQALECYTLGAAYSLHQETWTGSITVGKRADFVVLSAAPTAANLLSLKAEHVYVDGKQVV